LPRDALHIPEYNHAHACSREKSSIVRGATRCAGRRLVRVREIELDEIDLRLFAQGRLEADLEAKQRYRA
jgi:hypothetical protein